VSYTGGDFGFVGNAYEAPDPYQDSQRLINWYVEVSQDDKSKTPTALLGCPGLNLIMGLFFSSGLQVRGAWVLPGGNQCVWICGDTATLMTVSTPATQTSIAQFTTAFMGNLKTKSGQVCIRDNGAGGNVVIVDGQYGYTYNLSTGIFAQITDPAFLGADRVAFIDGWLIFNQPGTQNFYTTAPTPYTVTFSGAFFAKNDTSSDNLITLMENNRELWLVGERHSEVWYDAGGANFAFSRIPGIAPQIGCAAKHSIARLGSSLVWLGKSERGENVVIKTEQYSYIPISNRALEHAIASYPLVSDAFGYTYEEDGHLFYMLTFPTADVTWCYDHTSSERLGEPCWHQRLSFDPNTGAFHRHRSNCFVNFQDVRMVGDYQLGTVMQMSRNFYSDNTGNGTFPLIAVRRAPHLWSKEDRERLFHSSLQIEFSPGVGLQVGQGSDPQAMLRFSDDGGATYGTIRTCTIGKAGRTKNRAIWRRLGQARDRVYEVSISDPVKRDIVGATLYAEKTEASG
jgi:hypothetical protein